MSFSQKAGCITDFISFHDSIIASENDTHLSKNQVRKIYVKRYGFSLPWLHLGHLISTEIRIYEVTYMYYSQRDILQSGVVEPCEHTPGEIISNIFPRLKRDGSFGITPVT